MIELTTNKIATLNEISWDVRASKSKLNYYKNLGLITPIAIIGKVQAFDKDATIKRLKKIEKLRGQKKTLEEIVKIIKKEDENNQRAD